MSDKKESIAGRDEMRFRRRFSVFVPMALTACVLLVFFPLKVSAQPALRVHNVDTGISYGTIQEALDDNATSDGHVIRVDAGTYHELVNVYKAVSLVGENSSTTIIDGQGNGTVITVQAAEVVITGFTIRNSSSLSGSAGVQVRDSILCNVSGNLIEDNWYGVWLRSCGSSTVSGNDFLNNSNGIYADSVTNSLISKNDFSSNDFAAWLDGANDTVFRSNTVSGNNYAVWVTGSSSLSLSENWIADNSDGVLIYGDSNSVTILDNTIHANSGYAVFMNAVSNSLVTGNHVSSEGREAIYVQSSQNNNFTANTVVGDGYDGVFLELSSGNVLQDNIVTGSKNAIEISASVSNVVARNYLYGNSFGVVLSGSDESEVLQNTLLGNGYGMGVTNSRSVSIEENNLTGNVNEGIRLTLSPSGKLINNVVFNCNQAIVLTNTSDALVSGNNVGASGTGALLLNSHNVTMVGNNLWNNGASLVVNASNGNFVYNNILTHNVDGFTLWRSNNNTIELNVVSLNLGRGIYVSYSDFNVIIHNGFFNNSLSSASLNSSNTWDDGVEGNFWGYTGFVDSDRNGIADGQLVLGDGEKDDFPLMAEYVELSTVVNDRQYTVGIVSNSSVSDLNFVQTAENGSAVIMFRVNGVEGTVFCRVGIPRSMGVAPFDVTIDNSEPSYQNVVGSNATHTWLYFSFSLGRDVRITTAAAAPPFWAESWFWGIMVLGVVVAVLSCSIFLFHRRLTVYRKTVEEVERKLRERESSPLEVARRMFSSDVERRSVKIGAFEEKYGIKIRPRESLDAIFRGLEKKNKGESEEDDEVNS